MKKLSAEQLEELELDWVEQIPFYADYCGAKIKKEKIGETLFRYTVIDNFKNVYLTVESVKDIKSFFERKKKKSK